MKELLDKGYKQSQLIRWCTVALLMAIAFGMFGLEVAIFTYVATLVAHEVPTMVIGAYIIHKLKHRIVRNEGTK